MTPEQYQQAKSIFAAACERSREHRDAYVAAACGEDVELRDAVDELLNHDDAPIDFEGDHGIRANLDAILLTSGDGDPATRSETYEAIPEQIGKYHITRKIGEGGMGVVYEARQESPRRRVALKLLRAGLAPAESLRRFRREIEVLGRFQHPSIAQIYEAGTANLPGGATLPFFAMELIDGMPLTAYAEAHKLDTRQRLDLMATICETVHYAHHKGVVHRDLKPSNILVVHVPGIEASATNSTTRSQASQHAGALPKILDFGVARALDPENLAATLQTDTGRLIGTIAYMSPEQIAGRAGGLDARSDVYTLGVILYELLSMRLPHDITGKSVAEAIWRIREEDPTELASINAAFRGDVSTIVSKAIEKDVSRRYQTAADMAADIRRYLRDEPIVARPATTLYQLGKFAKRNKALVTGACIAAVALVLATAVSSWQAYIATAARDEAKQETVKAREVNRFLQDILSSADPNKTLGEEVSVVSLLDTAANRLPAGHFGNQPDVLMELHHTIGASYLGLGQYAKAEAQYRAAIELCEAQPDAASTPALSKFLDGLGTALALQNEYDEAEVLLRRAKSIRERTAASGAYSETAWPCALADVFFFTGRYEEAEASYRESLANVRRAHGPNCRQAAEALNGLGVALEATSRLDEAIAAHREAVEIYRSLYGELHMEVATCLGNLGNALQGKGDLAAAEAVHREALKIRRTLLKPDHPLIATNLGNLALVLMEEGKLEESEQMGRETLAIKRATLPAIHHSIAVTLNNLATVLKKQARYDESLQVFDEAIAIAEQALPEGHLMPVVFRANRASCLTAIGRYEEAERALLASYEALVNIVGADHRRAKQVAQFLVDCYTTQGKPTAAAIWTERAG